MQPTVLNETANFLVLNKPTGLITHSDGRTIEPTLAEWLACECPEQKGIGEPWVSPQGEHVDVVGLVHRLDRMTSGVLLAAKSDAVFSKLREMLKRREITKIYRALVYGHLQNEGRIVAEIARTSERPRKWYARACDDSDPRAAITNWRVLQRFEQAGEMLSYIELRPETGRTHQIRVHLASIAHPVVADHVYAPEKKALGFTRLMLHAYNLSFEFDGAAQNFIAPVPKDFPKI